MRLRRTAASTPAPTVFLVDDEPEVIRALSRALVSTGYDVVGVASNPRNAVNEIAQRRPDIVVMDLDLRHELSGVDVALHLRPMCDVPIVFLTGAADPDLGRLTGLDGVIGYLSKPVTPTVLRTTIELVRMQHLAHGRLRELEHRYHALFDQAAVGVIQLDATSGLVVEANRKCAEIFACTVDDLLDSPLADWCDIGGAVRTGEVACVRRDGSRRRLRLDVSALGAEHAVIIVQDVTDRRLTEDLLDRHRELLTQSQRMASIGSYHLDFTTGVITWTDEMYRIYGVSPAQFTPTPGGVLALIHPADRAAILEGMSAPAVPEPRTRSYDFRVVHPDGTVRTLRGYGELMLDDRGRPVAVVGTTQDVTEREQALSASREAIEASRAKTDFLAHMSHELRTPLNAVLGLSEALLERTFGDLNDAQANALATIHDSGRHLLELINDVLDIARVESGKLPIEPEQVLLRPLIDESTALVYAQVTGKGQRLVIELEPALPPVDVDKRRIKQVLINLLANAVKFSPPGATVTLRARSHPARREVELAVADTGPGIAAADQQRIFEPFVTLDPSMTREHAGAGLGLALVKRIVELHGGTVRVESTVGAGSCFVVTLPVSSSYAGAPLPSRSRPPSARGTPRLGRPSPVVLLIEDNEANVATVRGYLEIQGYDVRVVRDGMSAVDAAAAPDVAVVLMDVQLPGIDGLEATRRIRARQDGDGKPIIALTAYAMPGDEERCRAAGASAYLAKPVRLRELADTIERFLAHEEPRP